MSAKDVIDIRKSLSAGKVVIGAEETVKNIKLGKVSKVYLGKNCPKDTQEDIERYSKTDEIECTVLNDSLDVVCKKPFSISVLSILSDNEKDKV